MATTSIPSSPIVFYDIKTGPPVEKTCFSPNPWKTRLALNFKVALSEIPKVRSSLKVPPVRKFANGTDYYTLPIIEDPATDSLVGDSFDIAVYLQKTYPNLGAGNLFPPQTLNYVFTYDMILVPLTKCRQSEFLEYAKFNVNVDAAFSTHVQLAVQAFHFDPATEEASKAEFDFTLVGEAREKVKDSFQNMLDGLAKLFLRDTTELFLLRTRANYANMIVDAWLRMMRVTLSKSEWEEVRSWHGGLFGRLHDALEVYAVVK
ncbi:hypothetical protein QBC46DRAFT_361947 [Diplogelasinospora grovesii]|uniref:GST N-terminal domain-containing protein n=1 Tax=Diplogelasinospora grovesii TaxID=303347 RepID=A0AAN6S7S8_9PEZI|nr:hypothetical protein QBC46DRAFT_361947 [Diplogelasinospora grovesii]